MTRSMVTPNRTPTGLRGALRSMRVRYASGARLLGVALLCALVTPAAFARTSHAGEPPAVDFESLLRALVDPAGETLGRGDVASMSVQSSRDQGSIDPSDPAGWFSESDSGNVLRIDRIDGRSEWVLADLKGGGAVTRIVLTSSVVIRDAVIRIRIDGETSPAIEWPLRDIAAKVAPRFAPFVVWSPGVPESGALPSSVDAAVGSVDCILPIPFTRSCVVTLDRRPDLYRVEAVSFDEGVRVERLPGEAAIVAAGGVFSEVQREAVARLAARNPQPIAAESVVPGGRIERMVDGSGVVRRLAIQIDPFQAASAVRNLWIECDFDGVSAIRMPLGSFMGLGEQTGRSGDALRTVGSNGALEFRVPMPFARNARVAISNRGGAPLACGLELAEVAPRTSSEPPHLLHGGWREHRRLSIDAPREVELARIEGTGALVGECFSQHAALPTWWPRGDDRLKIDGRDELAGPSFALVFGNAPEVPLYARGLLVSVPSRSPAGWNMRWGGSRLRALDVVRFSQSMVQTLEVLPASVLGCEITLAQAVLWYAQAGASRGVGFEDPAAMPPVATPQNLAPLAELFPPGVGEEWFEAENLAISFWTPGTNWAPETIGVAEPTRAWGSGGRVGLLAVQAGDAIEFAVPARDNLPRRLTARFVRSVDAARLAIFVNGVRVPGEVVLGSLETVPSDLIDLGVHAPKDGAFRVRIAIAGLSEFARRRLHMAVDGFRTSPP